MARQEISIDADGAVAARRALETCVTGGGVALFPADGVYGLACDPLNAAAIARLHAIKGRDDGKPSAVMYFSVGAMRELISGLPDAVRPAMSALLPGPVTLIVPNPEHRYPLACRDDLARLGVRLIEGPLAGVSTPVFQTSANRSGEPAVSTYTAVDPAIVGEVDLALDGGALGGRPSTVIDLTALPAGGSWRVLREGALTGAEVESLLGRPD